MSRDACTSRCWSDCGFASRDRGRVTGEVVVEGPPDDDGRACSGDDDDVDIRLADDK